MDGRLGGPDSSTILKLSAAGVPRGPRHSRWKQASTGPRLPFLWQKLTDEDKAALIDSTRNAMLDGTAARMGAAAQRANRRAALEVEGAWDHPNDSTGVRSN